MADCAGYCEVSLWNADDHRNGASCIPVPDKRAFPAYKSTAPAANKGRGRGVLYRSASAFGGFQRFGVVGFLSRRRQCLGGGLAWRAAAEGAAFIRYAAGRHHGGSQLHVAFLVVEEHVCAKRVQHIRLGQAAEEEGFVDDDVPG